MTKIVAVHSFCRGAGKSSIVANTATLLAQDGMRVGAIDTALSSPGLHFFFRRSGAGRTLNDYLWGRCTIEETAHQVQQVGNGSLYLVPASTQPDDVARAIQEGYDTDTVNRGIRSLATSLNLDYILLDTNSGLNEETLASIAICDLLLVVLRPDQRDLQGSAVMVDVARRLEVPNLYMVVNQAISSYEPDNLRRQIKETYDAPVAAIIPLSEDVAAMQSAAIFVLSHPGHTVSRRMEEIVAAIETGDKTIAENSKKD